MDRTTEIEAVAGLKRGEASAFDAVYEAFRPRVFSFALRLTGRREVAEDVAQETWMRLAARAGHLRDDTFLGAWLFTVARHLCISAWRSSRHEAVVGSDDDLLEVSDADRPSPLQSLEASELQRRIEHALARLPVAYREVLVLVGVEGLAPGEAAAVCGVSPEALRKRLQRARDMLAEELGACSANAVNGGEADHGRTDRRG